MTHPSTTPNKGTPRLQKRRPFRPFDQNSSTRTITNAVKPAPSHTSITSYIMTAGQLRLWMEMSDTFDPLRGLESPSLPASALESPHRCSWKLSCCCDCCCEWIRTEAYPSIKPGKINERRNGIPGHKGGNLEKKLSLKHR